MTMIAAELTFRSWLAVAGYRWVRYDELGPLRGQEGHPKHMSGWMLTENHDTKNPEPPRRYEPRDPLRDHPVMFREFAEIPWGDRAAATSFASKYGMLDADTRYYYPAYPLPPGVHIPARGLTIPCDPEAYWTETPAMFRVIIRVWESRRAKREKDLAELLRWEKSDSGYAWVCRPNPKRDNAPDLPVRIIYRNWGSPSAPWEGIESLPEVANAFLRQEITKGLDHGRYRAQFARDPASDRHLFQITPTNLLGALFLQLGQAIAGDREQRPCKECGKWFELVPQDKGRKEFCSDACKAKEYRERKKRALEMRAQGRTPKQIADEIKTGVETVRGWVGKAKPKRKDR
jgi:hypothetical protein